MAPGSLLLINGKSSSSRGSGARGRRRLFGSFAPNFPFLPLSPRGETAFQARFLLAHELLRLSIGPVALPENLRTIHERNEPRAPLQGNPLQLHVALGP